MVYFEVLDIEIIQGEITVTIMGNVPKVILSEIRIKNWV